MQIAAINAAPMVLPLGTQDLSITQPARVQQAIPQHLAKFFIYAQKGPTVAELVSGAEAINMYGADTFDVRKKYANHQTAIMNAVMAQGSQVMVQRLIPADAPSAARILLCLDVLKASIPTYTRDAQGNFLLNAQGAKIPVAGVNVTGYSVQWVSIPAPHATAFGASVPGTAVSYGLPTRTDATLTTTNTIYPIFEVLASSIGAFANNAGIRLWAPTFVNSPRMPTKMMAEVRAYPYNMAMVQRATPTTSPAVVQTQMTDTYVMTTVKPGSIDPATDSRLYAGDIFINSYRNVTDLRFPPVFGNFSDMAVYQANIDLILNQFMATEVAHIIASSDFTATLNGADYVDKYLFNFVSGVSSAGIGYETFQVISTVNDIKLGQYSDIMATGGGDGTMSDALHAGLVTTQVNRYLDTLDELQDLATNVESIIYDTGFPLATKQALASFISVRKDTFVVLGTHEVGGAVLTSAEENSVAIALRTRLQMFPESDYFGTPVMRGMIVGRSGTLRSSQYTQRVPMTAEVAIKASRYMGAGNGAWKNGYAFDSAPGSIIEFMDNINIGWVPNTVRNVNWDAGLNFVLKYDRSSYFFLSKNRL